MSARVSYEWDLETYDGDAQAKDSEVLDHTHADFLRDLAWLIEKNQVHVLVRTTEDGDRSWAYVDTKSRMLPAEFSAPDASGEYRSTGVRVPQAYHREIARVACGK